MDALRGTTLQNRDSPIFNPTQMCHNLPAECAYKSFNQASYYIPTSPYPPVQPPGNPKATRRPPTWPAVAFSAFVPQSLKQKNPKCPKTAVTEKPPNQDQPTIVTCSNGARKVVCKCASLDWVAMARNGISPMSLHFFNSKKCNDIWSNLHAF